ncbi:Lrp/AsnC family transcriptional regulator [Agrococcus jejuensis]|uniref:DNA-binding transcriptional regulator, Lrp family n=1 Tax=Agrococcus jejuensis TaxID=399736 RepID=A0A1G8DNK2_9MICO|nr:Lrp/AsnC family transcriptional regulator [Agrococcus jejuensis]SDH59185.1 DNA-binding transcriptional regulator, Lrp family [Agrococcus jejuensis]
MSRPLLDETDLDIVAALHIAPRVPTAALAEILGIPTSTASRRLTRMQDERLLHVVGRFAWELITSSNPFELWITSAPGQSRAVLAELLRIPDVQFVIHTSGAADLYVNLFPLLGSDHEELLAVTIPSIPGIRAIDSRMILEPAKVGQSWRYRRLDAERTAALEAHASVATEAPIEDLHQLSELEFETMRMLGANGRVTAAEVGRTLGVSASTAARAIRLLIHSGAVSPRVEMQPDLMGYPLNGIVTIDVRPRDLRGTLEALAAHPSVRLLSTVTGTAPVSLAGVFEGPAALAAFVRDDLGSMPGVRSVQSVAGLRLERRYWIDREGLRLGAQVPDVLRR